MKKVLALLLVLVLSFAVVACGTPAPAAEDEGGLIKVGIINNDPNESGYRTANDKDMKATFTEANGYDASFAYSLKKRSTFGAICGRISGVFDVASTVNLTFFCKKRRSDLKI